MVALVAKEEVVAVLAHPAVLHDHLLAVEAIVHPLLIETRLHHHLELVLAPVRLRCPLSLMQRPLEETLLTCLNSQLHRL